MARSSATRSLIVHTHKFRLANFRMNRKFATFMRKQNIRSVLAAIHALVVPTLVAQNVPATSVQLDSAPTQATTATLPQILTAESENVVLFAPLASAPQIVVVDQIYVQAGAFAKELDTVPCAGGYCESDSLAISEDEPGSLWNLDDGAAWRSADGDYQSASFDMSSSNGGGRFDGFVLSWTHEDQWSNNATLFAAIKFTAIKKGTLRLEGTHAWDNSSLTTPDAGISFDLHVTHSDGTTLATINLGDLVDGEIALDQQLVVGETYFLTVGCSCHADLSDWGDPDGSEDQISANDPAKKVDQGNIGTPSICYGLLSLDWRFTE